MPAKKLTDRSAGEEAFINEMTRQFLVGWCHYQISHGQLPHILPALNSLAGWEDPYVDFAVKKGWVSKGRDRILSTGWKTAAAYLRR